MIKNHPLLGHRCATRRRTTEMRGSAAFALPRSIDWFGHRLQRKEITVTQITKETIQDAMAAAEEAAEVGLIGRYPMACRTLATTVQVLRDELALAEAERDALRAFAQAVMECWPMGDLDGGTLQDAAVAHGLLIPETRHEPCAEGCNCAENADELATSPPRTKGSTSGDANG